MDEIANEIDNRAARCAPRRGPTFRERTGGKNGGFRSGRRFVTILFHQRARVVSGFSFPRTVRGMRFSFKRAYAGRFDRIRYVRRYTNVGFFCFRGWPWNGCRGNYDRIDQSASLSERSRKPGRCLSDGRRIVPASNRIVRGPSWTVRHDVAINREISRTLRRRFRPADVFDELSATLRTRAAGVESTVRPVGR